MVPHSTVNQTFTVNTNNDTDVSPSNSTTCQDASGNCSLRAAIEAANNDYPNIDQINVPAGADIQLTQATEIDVTNSMFITGSGGGATPIVDGLNATEIFYQWSNTAGFTPEVQMTNLTVEGGNSGNGGDFYVGSSGSSTADLTLVGVNVITGTASSDGGGMYVQTDSAVWTDNTTHFANNTASSGGGIYSHDGQVYAGGSLFTGNTATSSGGAVYNDGGYVGDTVTYANNASPDGGAIYNNYSMIDTNGQFQGNNSGTATTTTAYGTAVVNEDVATINNATVTNSSSLNVATSQIDGGAFYNDYMLQMTNISVSGSQNRADGGSIYGGVIYNNDNLTLNGLTTTGTTNGATGADTYIEGGVLYNDSTATVNGLTASNTTNTAGNNEIYGGVFSNESSGSFTNFLITGTTATSAETSSTTAVEGGAGYNDSSLSLSNTVISGTNTSSTTSSGEIFGGALGSDSDLQLTNVSIDSTTETAGGAEVEGAVYTDSGTNINGMSVTNTTISDTGGGNGYVIGGGWFNGSTMTATNVQVLDTSVTVDSYVEGGAFANDGSGSVINSGTFARTNATVNGTGAGKGTIAYLEEPMTLTNVTMADNTASVPAASLAYGIYLDDKIQFVNDTIANNTLTPVGGSFGANSGGFGFEGQYTESFSNTIVQFNGVPNCHVNLGGNFASSGGNV
jgi:CSLREA domain-containing protein